MSFKKIIFPLLLILVFACSKEQTKKNVASLDHSNQTMYYNGDIITMTGEQDLYVEAVIAEGEKIIFTGTKEEAINQFPRATHHDLKGQTMLPGFIEPHLHPSLAAVMLQNEIIAPYDWQLPDVIKKGVQTPEGYKERIKTSILENADTSKLYIIWGYHQFWHGDLNREMLNEIAGDLPVGIIHRSFHEIFLNDAGLEILNISEEEFKGNPQVDWKKGHFYEGGWLALVPKMAPTLLEPTSYLKGLSTMSKLLLQNGITTIAEPGFPGSNFDGELALLKKEMAKKPPFDVYLIPSGTQLYSMKGGNQEALSFIETLDTTKAYNTENIHFLKKQVKLYSDGAIYSQLMQMKEGYTDGHHGEWMTPLDLFKAQLNMYWDNNYKIHVHANGDLGQQMVIDLVREAQQRNPRQDHRLTLHHMGYFNQKMVDEIAELGIEGSVNPYYLWALADKYTEYGLGAERAENLVAIKLLADKNIPFSFHSDFSMAPVEPLTLAWTGINRRTSQGSDFSQDQRISVYDGIKAITFDAARTLNLENEIGSIAKGKVANFTILENNPFKVKPIDIKDIPVKEIVYKGKLFPVEKKKALVGGWQSTDQDETAAEVTKFAIDQLPEVTEDDLKEILDVKKQIVNGTNYEVIFELKNGLVYKCRTHKSLDGKLKNLEPTIKL